MKVINKHTAALTPPGGDHLNPGEVGEANAAHHVTHAWLSAGLLAAADEPEPATEAPPTSLDEPSTQKRSRKS